MASPILSERQEHALVLTLNRPQRKNALSTGLLEELHAQLRAPGEGVRVIVLTGAADVFCAGGDLSPASDDGMLAQHRGRGLFADTLRTMMASRVPIVGAINGDALGGGFGLAAACHLLVADERAHFATPELKLGLFPWMIAPVLMRSLPRKIVHDMILTGRRLAAPEAHGLGLVNRLAPPGEALPFALALAQQVGSWSPAVVGFGLEALHTIDDLPLDAALAHMHAQLSLNLMFEDAGEGITAFLSRRPPVWKGR